MDPSAIRIRSQETNEIVDISIQIEATKKRLTAGSVCHAKLLRPDKEGKNCGENISHKKFRDSAEERASYANTQ